MYLRIYFDRNMKFQEKSINHDFFIKNIDKFLLIIQYLLYYSIEVFLEGGENDGGRGSGKIKRGDTELR